MNHWLRVEGLPEAADFATRSVDELLSAQLSQKKLHPQRPQPSQDAGQLKWRDPIDAEHVQGCGVIAEDQRTTITRSPPQALATERYLPIRGRPAHVGIE